MYQTRLKNFFEVANKAVAALEKNPQFPVSVLSHQDKQGCSVNISDAREEPVCWNGFVAKMSFWLQEKIIVKGDAQIFSGHFYALEGLRISQRLMCQLKGLMPETDNDLPNFDFWRTLYDLTAKLAECLKVVEAVSGVMQDQECMLWNPAIMAEAIKPIGYNKVHLNTYLESTLFDVPFYLRISQKHIAQEPIVEFCVSTERAGFKNVQYSRGFYAQDAAAQLTRLIQSEIDP